MTGRTGHSMALSRVNLSARPPRAWQEIEDDIAAALMAHEQGGAPLSQAQVERKAAL